MKDLKNYIIEWLSSKVKIKNADISDKLKKWPSYDSISIKTLVDLLDKLNIPQYYNNSWSSSIDVPDLKPGELAYGYDKTRNLVELYSNPDNEIQSLFIWNDGVHGLPNYRAGISKGSLSVDHLSKSDIIDMMKVVILDPTKTWDLKKPWLL